MGNTSGAQSGARARAAEELKRYLIVSAYLFVCFSVILFYETSQMPDKDPSWTALGVALGKALVIGKFILIGEALKAGRRARAPTFLRRVTWRSLGLLVVLIVLKIVEELLVGLAHGKSLGVVLGEFGDRSWFSLLGPVLLMLLILIPLVTLNEIHRALGSEGFSKLIGNEVSGRETR